MLTKAIMSADLVVLFHNSLIVKMEENFLHVLVVSTGVHCCCDGKSFRISLPYSLLFSDDQWASVHLPHQYAPHPTELMASVYSRGR